jgi:hypothetical protein
MSRARPTRRRIAPLGVGAACVLVPTLALALGGGSTGLTGLVGMDGN